MYYYGYDISYFLYVMPLIILSLLASANVKRTFAKYSKQLSARHITAADAARIILRANGITGIQIAHISGQLTDHFDPSSNSIRLSDGVYDNSSVAAIGIACHEAGHAIQHDQGYWPVRMRTALVPVINFGSRAAMPLIFIGILFESLGRLSQLFIYLGIACFGLTFLFQLITLPVEFDASRRALEAIKSSDLLTDSELAGARKTLTAAACTYLAAFAVSLAQLLRLIMLYGRRRRND